MCIIWEATLCDPGITLLALGWGGLRGTPDSLPCGDSARGGAEGGKPPNMISQGNTRRTRDPGKPRPPHRRLVPAPRLPTLEVTRATTKSSKTYLCCGMTHKHTIRVCTGTKHLL